MALHGPPPAKVLAWTYCRAVHFNFAWSQCHSTHPRPPELHALQSKGRTRRTRSGREILPHSASPRHHVEYHYHRRAYHLRNPREHFLGGITVRSPRTIWPLTDPVQG